jgi:hypothetical protein
VTAQTLPSVVRQDGAEPDGRAQEVSRLFDAKAAGCTAKYAPEGSLTGRPTDMSTAVGQYARAGRRILDLECRISMCSTHMTSPRGLECNVR